MSLNPSFQRHSTPFTAATCAAASILLSGLLWAAQSTADPAPAPARSKHQMMKECMAKQKASEAGRPKEEMKKSCRDLISTEKQNAERASTAQEATPSQ